MLDRIKKIPVQLYAIWNKYSKKQKTIILSAVGAVFLALIILIVLANQIDYKTLNTFEDTKTAKKAIEYLNEAGIKYQLMEDQTTLQVDESKYQDAILLLTDTEVSAETGFTYEDFLENDLNTTKTDKEIKYSMLNKAQLRKTFKQITGVEDADIQYYPSDNQNSIFKDQKEIPCTVFLTINKEFDKLNTPKSIATVVASAIGNQTLDKIKVTDNNGNILFNGEEENSKEQGADRNLAYRKELISLYKNLIYELSLKNGYTDAEIVPNFDINFDQTSVLYTEYLAAEGQEQGLQDTFHEIVSENTGTGGDIPGTDSNDETDYFIQTGTGGNSTYSETNIKYIPSTRVTETLQEIGAFDLNTSTMAITLTRVVTQTEEELELLGLLEGTTFDEYILNNGERTVVEVGEEYYDLFSKASGIPVENIRIIAYDQPNFIPRETTPLDWAFYLQIILAALIVALLVFVIFRGMKQEDITEVEPELSIEQLLATTKENQSLEEVEFGDKSETRIMIEKFVDENPEAVAKLLRNWLNDDEWG